MQLLSACVHFLSSCRHFVSSCMPSVSSCIHFLSSCMHCLSSCMHCLSSCFSWSNPQGFLGLVPNFIFFELRLRSHMIHFKSITMFLQVSIMNFFKDFVLLMCLSTKLMQPTTNIPSSTKQCSFVHQTTFICPCYSSDTPCMDVAAQTHISWMLMTFYLTSVKCVSEM